MLATEALLTHDDTDDDATIVLGMSLTYSCISDVNTSQSGLLVLILTRSTVEAILNGRSIP